MAFLMFQQAKGVTLTELIATIELVTDKKLIANIVPDTRNDLELKRIGNTKNLESLGWKCKISLEDGIRRTWSWINTMK